jgi:hypothetical protein
MSARRRRKCRVVGCRDRDTVVVKIERPEEVFHARVCFPHFAALRRGEALAFKPHKAARAATEPT